MLTEAGGYSVARRSAANDLKEIILAWISENPNIRSASQLARDSNVSESCIRRIINDGSLPSSDNLFKLVSYLKPGSCKQVLENSGAKISEILKLAKPYLDDSGNGKVLMPAAPSLEKTLSSFTVRTIFFLSSFDDGLTVKKANEMFGEAALSAVEYLKSNSGCIVKDGVIYTTTNEATLVMTSEFFKSYLPELIVNFSKPNSKGSFNSCAINQVSKEGYLKLFDHLVQSTKEMVKIINENPGTIPVFVGSSMDTISFSPTFEKNEGV